LSRLNAVLKRKTLQVSLGGGGGFEGFYGSVTAGGVSKVYKAMAAHCNFDASSFLVDIGGGLGRCATLQATTHRYSYGSSAPCLLLAEEVQQALTLLYKCTLFCRPLMHALVEPGVKQAIGIEVDAIKCMKSESVIHEACQKMLALGLPVECVPLVLHRNIEAVCFQRFNIAAFVIAAAPLAVEPNGTRPSRSSLQTSKEPMWTETPCQDVV
jgi:hypothetical protein